MSQRTGPPYASPFAAVGGTPTTSLDVPVCAVFLAVYLGFAVTNMSIYQLNARKQHIKFSLSALIFGFCMSRVMAMTLRIVSATRPYNLKVTIAANVFANAGILIIYILNFIFAQRILRAENPRLGWSKILRTMSKVLYALLGGVLVMVITAVVLSSYSRNGQTLKACRDIMLAATTYLFVFTTLPLFHVAAAHFLSQPAAREWFGRGKTGVDMKKLVVIVASLLSITIAGFKLGTTYMSPRLESDPAWYQSKAAFYCFDFMLEIMILALLTISRVDRLFWVPNGSRGPGDYTRLARGMEAQEKDDRLDSLEKA